MILVQASICNRVLRIIQHRILYVRKICKVIIKIRTKAQVQISRFSNREPQLSPNRKQRIGLMEQALCPWNYKEIIAIHVQIDIHGTVHFLVPKSLLRIPQLNFDIAICKIMTFKDSVVPFNKNIPMPVANAKHRGTPRFQVQDRINEDILVGAKRNQLHGLVYNAIINCIL